jgi:hypothetical protein
MSNVAFLRSVASGREITGTPGEQSSFGKHLKQYRLGKLQSTGKKRHRESPYLIIEKKLVQYIRMRQLKYQQDKCGLSWDYMKLKCLEWAKLEDEEKYATFSASAGFINRVLDTHRLEGVHLHGEANDMTDEERQIAMAGFRDSFHKLIADLDIPPERACTASGRSLHPRLQVV